MWIEWVVGKRAMNSHNGSETKQMQQPHLKRRKDAPCATRPADVVLLGTGLLALAGFRLKNAQPQNSLMM